MMDLVSEENVEVQPENPNDTDDFSDKSDEGRTRPSRVFTETCLEKTENVNWKDKYVHEGITNLL